MKRIVTIPAGRKRYLEILLNYLKFYKDEYDRLDIWLNTNNKEDIDWIKYAEKENSFINIVYPEIRINGSKSIFHFYKKCINEDEVYVRLDDDIVYIEKGSLNNLFEGAINGKEYFILCGNIINNAIITHIQQRMGNFSTDYGISGYLCTDKLGWRDPIFAENIHLEFLSKYKNSNFHIADWLLYYNERFSINAISWRGDEFKKFDGIVHSEEEQFLTITKPKELKKYNKIIGNTLFVHFAFGVHRDYIDGTDLLSKYKKISEEYAV